MDKIEVVGDITFRDPVTRKVYNINVWRSIEDPLFKAVDIAKIIDYSIGKTAYMLELVEEYEKIFVHYDSLGVDITHPKSRGGSHEGLWFLTEYGLYEVLMQSRKPIAKRFKLYVKDILHNIRKRNNWQFFNQDEHYTNDDIYYDDEEHRLSKTIGMGPNGDPRMVYLYDGSSIWVDEDGNEYEEDIS